MDTIKHGRYIAALIAILAAIAASSCASSGEPSDVDVATAQALALVRFTQTAEAASPTPPPTSTPIPTLTPTLTRTSTPEPTETPTPMPTALGGGGWIAYASNRDGNYDIYMMNPDGGNQTRITQSSFNNREPAWSPDGEQIVFMSSGVDSKHLNTIMVDGSDQFVVGTLPEGLGGSPCWSSSGRLVYWAVNCIYACDKGGIRASLIYFVDPDGKNLTWIKPPYQASNPLDTALSTSGNRIAVSNGGWSPRFMNIGIITTGGDTKADLPNYRNSREPAWSPDGTKIAFVSNLEGNYEIYIGDVNSGDVARLTNDISDDRHPTWSPDGLKIAFSSNRDGNWNIYLIDIDGSNPTRLTEDPGDDVEPSWYIPAGNE